MKVEVTAPGLIAVALHALGCGMPPLELGTRPPVDWSIIGGVVSGAGDYPAVGVTLTMGEVDGVPVGGPVCSGTLIAPDVVLTAAHCTDLTELVYGYRGTNIENYFSLQTDVRSFSSYDLELPADAVRIRELVWHPDWDLDAFYSFSGGLGDYKDIALAFLDARITSVTPAVVLETDDAAGIVEGAEVEIVGYGQTSAQDPGSSSVKHHASSFINEVGQNEMQIGDVPPGEPGKCYGDSGGPTLLQVDDGKAPSLRIIGVSSHVYDDTYCLRGGVDTRVDVHRAWVNTAMINGCAQGRRLPCSGTTGLAEPQPIPGVDAGVSDGGGGEWDAARPDSWVEGGPFQPFDATGRATALPAAAEDEQGCGCRSTSGPGSAAAMCLALLVVRRRRGAPWAGHREREGR